MKYIIILSTTLSLCFLPSCGLIGTALKFPGSLLRMTKRLTTPRLTDESPQRKLRQEKSITPERDHALEKGKAKD